MPEKKLPPSLLECGCGRNGYVLVLCAEHAPIPYELTDRGKREVSRMRQWDAIKDTVVASTAARRALDAADRRAGRKIEARARRSEAAVKANATRRNGSSKP